MANTYSNSPNLFCFVCGLFTASKHRECISPQILEAYNLYFGIDATEDISKPWSPKNTCGRYLRRWLNGLQHKMPFCVPMIWCQKEDHATECYFCLTKLPGFFGRSRNKIKYANVKSVSKTVPRISYMETSTPPSASMLVKIT